MKIISFAKMKGWINDFYRYLNWNSFTLYPLGIKEGPRIYFTWIFYSPWHICNGSKKGRYWGYPIEHKNKTENINLTYCFIVRYCCSKNTITLYILIFHWFFDLILLIYPPPPERNDQPVIDLFTIDSRLIAFCFSKLKSSRQLCIETLFLIPSTSLLW